MWTSATNMILDMFYVLLLLYGALSEKDHHK